MDCHGLPRDIRGRRTGGPRGLHGRFTGRATCSLTGFLLRVPEARGGDFLADSPNATLKCEKQLATWLAGVPALGGVRRKTQRHLARPRQLFVTLAGKELVFICMSCTSPLQMLRTSHVAVYSAAEPGMIYCSIISAVCGKPG